MVRRSVVAGVSFAALIAACNGSEIVPAGITGGSGASSGTEALAAAMPPIVGTALSRFDVPLQYEFTDLIRVVERVVPKSFGDIDERKPIGDDDNKHYAFYATRGPFTAFAHGADVYLRTTLSYEARGFYKTPIGATVSAGCGKGDDKPQVVIELITPLTLTPDWHLKSEARLGQVSPASDSTEDRCRVSILKLDVTDKVIDAAKKAITSKLTDIDARVARIDLTKKATGWWGHINKPIRLTDDVWLLLQPKQLRLVGVSGEKQVFTVQAGLDAQPVVVTGRKPDLPVPALPALGSDTSESGFSVVVDGLLDYGTASRALTEELRGKTFAQGGRTVTIESGSVAAAGPGRLALTITFSGDASGSLRFVGTPTHNAARRVVSVADLDYDLKTDSDLINAYAWLKSDALLAMFREKAVVPIGPVLERGREMITGGLNRTIGGVMTLTARVDSVAVVGLLVTTPGLLVRAHVVGDAHVYVKPKKKS